MIFLNFFGTYKEVYQVNLFPTTNQRKYLLLENKFIPRINHYVLLTMKFEDALLKRTSLFFIQESKF